jgi:hypothetical protein
VTISLKLYECRECGHEMKQSTNHTGATWSFGRMNVCPECPPWRKFPEYGGTTHWDFVSVIG